MNSKPSKWDILNSVIDSGAFGRLSMRARGVWAVLYRYSDADGTVRVTNETIARHEPVAVRSIIRAKQELVEADLLKIVNPGRSGPRGGRGTAATMQLLIAEKGDTACVTVSEVKRVTSGTERVTSAAQRVTSGGQKGDTSYVTPPEEQNEQNPQNRGLDVLVDEDEDPAVRELIANGANRHEAKQAVDSSGASWIHIRLIFDELKRSPEIRSHAAVAVARLKRHELPRLTASQLAGYASPKLAYAGGAIYGWTAPETIVCAQGRIDMRQLDPTLIEPSTGSLCPRRTP